MNKSTWLSREVKKRKENQVRVVPALPVAALLQAQAQARAQAEADVVVVVEAESGNSTI